MADALKKFSFVVAGVMVLVVLGIIAKFVFWGGKVSTDDAQIDGYLVAVSPRIPGTVEGVLVDDNQTVHAGQVLAILDLNDYKTKVAQAKANFLLTREQFRAARLRVPVTHVSTRGTSNQVQASLSASLAEEESAQDRISQNQAAIVKARADLVAAQSRLALAGANLNRTQLLIQNYVASEQQLDAEKTAYANAKADEETAQANLTQSKLQLAQSKNDLIAAQAKIEESKALVLANSSGPQQIKMRIAEAMAARNAWLRARADLKLAKLQLSYTVIRAPQTGIVTGRHVNKGEVVSAGQQIMLLAPSRQIWVTANFKETDLTKMKPGDKVEIHIDAFPGITFGGDVESIGAATGSATSLFPPENATGNFVKVVQRIPVRIFFDSKHDLSKLGIGMSVEATVHVK